MTPDPAEAINCRHLWAAVIHRAFLDATQKDAGTKEGGIIQHQARTWLVDAPHDFRRACHLASLDPEYVYDMTKKIRANGWRIPLTG